MDGRTFFKALLDSKQMNPHALAQKLKSPSLQSTLQRYLDGKTKEARRSTFEPVAEFFHVSLDAFYNQSVATEELKRLGLISRESTSPISSSDLAQEERSSRELNSSRSTLVQEAVPAFVEEAVHVPLLANSGSMGQGHDALHDDVLVGHIALSPRWISQRIQPTSPGALRFIHGYGDSMTPTFEDGDVLLVDTGARDPKSIDGVYVLSTNNRIYIKRVRQRMDGMIEVSSDNATVKTVDVLNGDHRIDVLGRVVWVWNGKKL